MADPIRICVSGCTGWTGGAVTKAILRAPGFRLAGAVARQAAGRDAGAALGMADAGVTIVKTLGEVTERVDVLIDYTKADSVKAHVLAALDRGWRVVVGASGLTAEDFAQVDEIARARNLGVIAAGNFSVTAALGKRCALLAGRYVPSWEIIDYADPHKRDAPSGTARELAEALAMGARNHVDVPIADTVGKKEARGATVGGAQLHSLRLHGYKFSYEAVFGMPGERLSIRHDAGEGAEPYVSGTLLAAEKVMGLTGLVRGMDTLLFGAEGGCV